MKSIFAFRRALTAAGLVLLSLFAVPSALATHLRGGSLSWKVTATTGTTYTVQFTLTESQRWSYPNPAGSCIGSVNGSITYCVPAGTAVQLGAYTGPGTFYFGDGSSVGNQGSLGDVGGTVTSINQAQDYATAVFVFSHTYNISAGQLTAYFYAINRIDGLEVGGSEPEYISTIVQNYSNPAPVASVPAILSVPLLPTATFNLSTAVSDIDPNVNLVYRLSTFAEIFGPFNLSGLTSVPCPSSVAYTQGGVASGNPPGFSISSAGVVTWLESQIQPAITGGNCGFAAPAAGDLWTAQVMVEVHSKTNNAIITKVPIDLLMQLVSPVGALPTVTINPSATQNVNINTPVSFTATASSSNAGAQVTLNASGVPAGATVTGLNATVTPPATSNFSWTPSALQAGTYVITYTVTDSNLQQAQASKTIVVATLPTISCSAGTSVTAGSSTGLTATVYDPSNELLNVVWTVDGNTVQTDNGVTAYPSAYVDSLTQTVGTAGVHAVTAAATDPHGVAVSCTTSVTVYQPTALVLASVSPTAGTPVTLTATLTTAPGGAPVAGQTVVFTSAGASPSTSTVTTNAAGVASTTVTFPDATNYTVTASFSNASGYFTDASGDIPAAPTVASENITVSQAATSLSAPSAPSTVAVGDTVTVSSTLSRVSAPSGPLTGASVSFQIKAPDNSVSTVPATTDANGLATATFSATSRGVYSITAQYSGTTALQASTSSSATVTAYQRTSLALGSANGTAGSNIALSATLTTSTGGIPLAAQTVSFDFAGVISSTSAVTDANGVATVFVQFPNAGSFSATASFSNPGGYFTNAGAPLSNPSPTVASSSVTVALAATSLSTPSVPSSGQVGVPFTVSTVLTRVSAPAGAVGGVPVTFTITAPDSTVTTLTATTVSSGLASVTVTPLLGGAYAIAALFAGNASLQSATSATSVVPVLQAPQAISFTPPPSPVVAGTSVVLSATGGASGNPVVFSVQSGPASLAADGVTLTYTGPGAVVVAADQPGNSGYTAAPEVTATIQAVAPAYIVTVNTDAASGNGVATNCVDPNLPTYTSSANANCSLRDAITAADALSVVTTNISFALSNPSTIQIASGTAIQITQNVNLNGPVASALTVEGGIAPYNGTTQTANNRILQISNGNVSISGLTFANAYTGPAGNGAAINAYGSAGTLTVSNSTFSGNQATLYGGAIVDLVGPLTVSNSTFSGNQAGDQGGALWGVSLAVANSTFSGNRAGNYGGATFSNGPATVSNSIFSGDSAPDGSGMFEVGGGSVVTNIVYNGDSFLQSHADITLTNSINANPNLGPLLNYGGSTPTLLPLPGSAAICAGTQPVLNGNSLLTDQRGTTISPNRYGQTNCYDVGAVQTEYGFSATFNLPSQILLGSPASPAPVATVTESGAPVTQFVATVNMTDADSDLSGAATVSLGTVMSTGQATFSNLLFAGAEVSDALTAVLPLNPYLTPALSLTATSNSFQVGKLTPTITVSQPSSIPYGTPSISLSGLLSWPGTVAPTGAVTFLIDSSISVPATCTSSGNCTATYNSTNLSAGPHTLTAGIAADTIFTAASSNSVQLYVSQATPSLSPPVAPAITYGTGSVLFSFSISYSGPAAPTGMVDISIDGGGLTPANCMPAAASTLNCIANYISPAFTLLSAGSHSVVASIAAKDNYTAANSTPGTLTVNPAPLNVSIIGNPTKPYDGTTAATLTSANYQVNGFSPIDVVTVTQPAGTYAAATAGPETVTASLTTSNFTAAASLNNYVLPTSATGPGTITQAPSVTTVTCPASVTYNGTAQTPCSAAVTGVGGLNQPVTTVTYLSNTNAGVNTASASATYAGDTNHAASSGSATFTIAPAATVTTITCPSSVVYSGAAQAPCSATVTGPGPFSQSVPVVYSANTNVGPVSVSATFPGDANHSGSTNSTTFQITPALVTAQAGVGNAIYDGNTHAPSACTVTGAYTGDLTCANSPLTVGPDVVTKSIAPVVSGSNLSDFTIMPVNGSYTINQAPSVTTLTCPASVTYNGGAQTPCTATATGAGNFSTSVSVTYTLNTNVGTANASAIFTGDANHTGSSKSTTFSITPAPLTVTAGSYAGVYDGNTHALSACVVSSNPSGLTCTNSPVGPVGPNVSGTIVVTPVLSGSASNYTVTTNNGSWSITARPVTITAGSYTGTYDGNTHTPSLCTSNYAGVTCTNNPASVGPGVGSNTISPVPAYPTGNAADYTVTPVTGTYSITQAPSVTTVSCPASVTYNYTAQTPCTASVTSVGGFSQSLTPTYTSNLHAGTATANATFIGDTNHAASTGTTTFTINKATPVITWPTPASFTYGTPLSTTQLNATASYLGTTVPGTSVYTAEGGLVNPYGVLLPPGTTALSYTINPTDSVDFNSATAYVVFTVSKAQTTTTIAVTTTQTVTGTTATITATVKPQIGGTPTGTITYYSGSTVLGSAAVGTPFTTGVLPVGTNQITAVYGGDSNFVGSSSSATTVTSIAPTNIILTPALTHIFYPASAVSYTVIVPLKLLQLVSGTITVYDGTTVIGTFNVLPTGVVVGITPQLSVGTHNLRAIYSGNAQYPPGESPIETVTVSAL